ncbi:MAG: YeeE/YedE family protein [Desulfuromonadales bacterium]|nr:YeeE/YedE family protein [Desulfuromonadales bacterium]
MESPLLLITTLFLALGVAAGWIMHRSDFCIARAFRDLFLFGDGFQLRMQLVVVAAAMLLFELGRLAGGFQLPFPLFGPPSVTHLVGGCVFGIGMVLAGGCVVGTLYKAGAGSVPSAMAVLGIVLGSALYAEMHPTWSALAGRLSLATATTLPQWSGMAPTPLVAVGFGLCLLVFRRWRKKSDWRRSAFAEGYLQPWKAALLIALIGGIAAVAVGMPLGITTGYSKIAGWAGRWMAPEHFAGLVFFASDSLDYLHPLYPQPLRGGAGARLDAIAAIQWPLIGGIALGSAASALILGEWHLRWQIPRRQYLSVLCGGVLMGVAARLGAGCTIWHLWGGMAIFALPSFLFVAGLFPGAWLGSRFLARYVI